MSNVKSIYVYGHSSSANHGNEAIVRGMKKVFNDYQMTVFSYDPDKDNEFNLDDDVHVVPMRGSLQKYHPIKIINHFYRKRTGLLYGKYIEYMFKHLFEHKKGVFLFEMGDQYCETQQIRDYYAYVNKRLINNGVKTVAYGCSIYPEVLRDREVIEDLNRYSLILPRESLTFRALSEVKINTEIIQIVDPAFVMDSQECVLPKVFEERSVVGINSGPVARTSDAVSAYDRYIDNLRALIEYIIKNTDFAIALIPHVNWGSGFSDLTTLSFLYDQYKDSGRIVMIPEQNAKKQKFVMSKCRLMIALRTHASIGAYSSFVPTQVTAYSKKAIGIAEDLFGSTENYVIPISSMQNKNKMIESFKWLLDNEKDIKEYLNEKIPIYIKGAFSAKARIDKLI